MAELEPLVQPFEDDPGGLAPETALELVEQISEYFKNLVDLSKLDQYLGVVFSDGEGKGLICFLKDQLTKKPFNGSKEAVLDLIRWTVSRMDKNWREGVAPYTERLKGILDLYWRNTTEVSRIQQLALDSLISLYEKYSEHLQEFPQLFWDLLQASEKSKYQPTVRGKMFHCLGLIAATSFTSGSSFISDEIFDKLFRHIVVSIQVQVESKDTHLEVSILLGCLKAMDQILTSFKGRLMPHKNSNKLFLQFYTNLEQIIDPQCSIAPAMDGTSAKNKNQLKRREFQRAGLELIANNSDYFSHQFYTKYKQWYEDLLTWAKSNNSDDNFVGRKAIFKFLECISTYGKTFNEADNQDELMETNEADELVKYFLETFQSILNTKNSNRSELLVAIKGIGWISTSCNNSSQVQIVFDKLMDHVQAIVVELNKPVTDKYSGSLSLISTYLESIGGILPQVDSSNTSLFLSQLDSIEALTIHLTTMYPDLSERVRFYAHLSLIRLVEGLQKKHMSACVPFLDRIINASLSHVIASPTRAELDILIEAWNKTNTGNSDNKKSARSQLGLRGIRSYTQFWINSASSKSANNSSVALIYDRIMQWILATIERLDLSLLIDSGDELQTFGNGDIFSSIKAVVAKDFHLFVNLVEFFQEFILKSGDGESPFFSKWADVLIMDCLKLIEKNPLVSGFYKMLATTLESCRKVSYFKHESVDKENLLDSCNKFMSSLTSKIDQFRDDLLVSILELWLSAPDEIIIQNFHSLNQTLKIIFSIGRSCLSLAEKCTAAIDRWILLEQFLRREDIETLVKNLYPVWRTYFVTAGNEESMIQETKRQKLTVSSKSKLRVYKDEKRLQKMAEELDDATLLKVQLNLLNLIGSFGHILDMGIEDEEISNNYKALDSGKQFLKYAVPLADMRPDIYFDTLVPRLIELCENSADRQTKTSACEMLHTVILYFLGYDVNKTSGATSPTQRNTGDLFIRIYRCVMKLACDNDALVRQLFNPLAIQSIRWFTQCQTSYAEIILSLIFEGLTQSEDFGDRRDFAGACLSEYFVWSLKHDRNNQKLLGRSILDQLCVLSTHAVTQYRLGAVVGFNGIYKEFREDPELKNDYTILLLTSFVTSLSLSASGISEEDSVTIKSTKLAIAHVERILLKKKDSFNHPIRGRKRPLDISSPIPVLNDLAEWILIQIAQQPDSLVRDECLRLLKVIGPAVTGCGSVDAFLNSFVNRVQEQRLISIAERRLKESMESTSYPRRKLQALASASTFYAMLISEPKHLQAEFLKASEDSVFISTYRDVIQQFSIDFPSCQQETEELLIVLSYYAALQHLFEFEDHDCYIELSSRLSKQFILQRLVSTEQIHCIAKSWTTLSDLSLSEKVVKHLRTLVELDISKITLSSIEGKGYFQWLLALTESSVLETILDKTCMDALLKSLWSVLQSAIYSSTSEISKNVRSSCAILFRIYVILRGNEDLVVACTFDQSSLPTTTAATPQNKGQLFLDVLFEVLLECPKLRNFEELTRSVRIPAVGNMIERFLSLMKRNRLLRRKYGEEIFGNVSKIWISLSVNCDSYTVARILRGLAAINLPICRDSENLASWWAGPEMITATHLSLKQKSEFIGFLGLFGLSQTSTIVASVMNAIAVLVERINVTNMMWKDEEAYLTKVIQQLVSVYENLPKQLQLLEVLIVCLGKCLSIAKSSEANETSANNELPSIFMVVKKRLLKVVKSMKENKAEDQQYLMASLLYKTILKNPVCHGHLVVTELYLIPVLAAIDLMPGQKFFKEFVFSSIERVKSLTSDTIQDLHLKTISFHVIEMVAHKCGPEYIKGELNDEYVKSVKGEKGASLLRSITDACIAFKRTGLKLPHTNTTHNQAQRKAQFSCNAASYNAAAATLLAASNKVNALEGFLIHEDRMKNFLWENIIDQSFQYSFPVVFEQTFVPQDAQNNTENILSFAKEETATDNTTGREDVSNKALTSVRLNLGESSLAIEATDYDFTTSVNVDTTHFYRRIFDHQERKSSKGTEKMETPIPDVSVVSSQLNRQECMLPFVATLKKLAALCKEQESTPNWVTYLQKVLKGTHHINIKIFIIGAFINCSEDILPYAKHFVEPILKLILDGEQCDLFGADKLNYFVKDIIVMLVSWKDSYVPEYDPNSSSSIRARLLQFLVQNCAYYEQSSMREDVVLHNLDLIRNVITLWNLEAIEIPVELIMQYFSDTERVKLALGICRNMLKAGITPHTNPEKLMKAFVRCLKSSSKPVYAAASENIGLLLQSLRKTNYSSMEGAEQFVKDSILAEKSRLTVYPTILVNLSFTSPQDILPFKSSIFELVNVSSVSTQIYALLPICLREELSGNSECATVQETASFFFADLDGRRVFQSFSPGITPRHGIYLLEIFTDHLKNAKKLMKILVWLKPIESLPTTDFNMNLLSRYASCALKIFKLIQEDSAVESVTSWSPVEQKLCRIFFRLFGSSSPTIIKINDEFWSVALSKWKESSKLMLELISVIGNEESALEIIVGLVLKRCAECPEFSKDIFDLPLSDCRYYTHNLDTSWRMRHASFQPMFAESLSSSQNFSTLPKVIQSTILSQRQNVGAFGVNLLRATLAVLQFTPTQNQQGSADREDSMETSMMIGDSMSENEFQFLQQRDGSSSSYNTDSDSISGSQKDPLASLRKRFYTRPQSGSGYYAGRELEKQSSKFNLAVEKIRSARNNVKLTRSYRVGDLPDILIKHSDLLKTLSTLGRLDKTMARHIFVLLYTSIVGDLKKRTENASDDHPSRDIFSSFISKSKETIETVMSKLGRSMDSQFVAGLIEICILNKILLKPSLITDICAEFDLHELGIIALEKWLEADSKDNLVRPSASKRPRMDVDVLMVPDSQQVSIWLGIAEFYKDMEEFDTLQNIFTIAASKSETSCRNAFNQVKQALAEDAAGDVDEACGKYASLCTKTNDYDSSFKKFLEDALMISYTKLSNWDDLFRETLNHRDKIAIDDEEKQKDYLGRIFPIKIKAGLQVYLGNPNPDSELTQEILSVVLNEGKEEAEFLNANYPLEVALITCSLDMLQSTGKASLLLDKAWQVGLKNFNILSKLPRPIQEERTLLLQQSASLQDVISWSKNLSKGNLLSKTVSFICKTKHLVGHPMAPLVNSHIIVAQRNHFIQKILETCQHNQGSDSNSQLSDTFTRLKQLNLNQHLWILSLGIRDKNIDIAHKYLEKARLLAENEFADDSPGKEMLSWRKMYVTYLSTFQKESTDEWLTMWASAYKKVSKSNNIHLETSDSIQMKGELLASLIQYMTENERCAGASVKKKVIAAISDRSKLTPGAKSFTPVVNVAKQESKGIIENLSSQSMDEEEKSSGESWCDAYKQMHLLLKLLVDKFPSEYEEDEQIISLFVKTLLRSIDPTSKEGSLLFPTILPLLEKYQSIHQVFMAEVNRVPCWVFLPWLDQIISSYRSNLQTQAILQPLVNRLTEDYPNAFQLQYSDILPSKLSSSIFVKKYTNALKTLALPEILHKDFFQKIESGRGTVRNLTAAEFANLYPDFKSFLIEIRNNEDGLYGELHTSFARDILNIETSVLSTNQASSASGDTQGIWSRLVDCLRDHKKKLIRKSNLPIKEFSPWLAKFHHAYNRDEIELPGLYDSLDKVNVVFHPKLVSFGPQVVLLSSLTKPLRVTFIGNNGKQYNFLVKRGDDLRQDRRIQQLLRISNKIFESDCRTKNRKLQLVTYSVIPISEVFGLTEWVDSTSPLKSFILSDSSLSENYIKSIMRHRKWIESSSGFLQNIKNVGRAAAETHMERMTSSNGGIPGELFTTAVMSRTSSSPEKFFRVRQQLIRSYATMCTVHWLLGIGDRHLENTLVSLESGAFVGIDFGRSFGTGNTLLPVPELVPFRLTNQLTTLMMPYGPNGLFKQSMLHSLRVLLASSSVYSAVIDIFVNEHSIDWLVGPNPKPSANSRPTSAPNEQILSKSIIQPMEIVKKKFRCVHPLSIIFEEIASNQNSNIRQPYKMFLEKERSQDLSALNTSLTPEETVDCLISLATDKSLLARIYFGWSSWV